MDDSFNTNNLTQDQNQSIGSDDQEEDTNEVGVSTGGFSPEVVSAPSQQVESQPQEESGYEQIRRIEKQAEDESGAEQQPVVKPTQPKQINEVKQAAKEAPQKEQPKYFGYTAPKRITSDKDYIESNVGKGDKKDSKTWLLVFLDRLLKKDK